jgi:transcriptional regulator with XRE-family HTH domain
MSKSKPAAMTDVIKRAITDSELTLYRIALDTGLTSQSLLRFMRGETSLRLDRADLLAEYLGLSLRPTKLRSRDRV